jgi:hypothetical protein
MGSGGCSLRMSKLRDDAHRQVEEEKIYERILIFWRTKVVVPTPTPAGQVKRRMTQTCVTAALLPLLASSRRTLWLAPLRCHWKRKNLLWRCQQSVTLTPVRSRRRSWPTIAHGE